MQEPLSMPTQYKSTDEGATVRTWVLLEAGKQGRVRILGRVLTPSVRNAELSAKIGASCSAFICVVLCCNALCACSIC